MLPNGNTSRKQRNAVSPSISGGVTILVPQDCHLLHSVSERPNAALVFFRSAIDSFLQGSGQRINSDRFNCEKTCFRALKQSSTRSGSICNESQTKPIRNSASKSSEGCSFVRGNTILLKTEYVGYFRTVGVQ